MTKGAKKIVRRMAIADFLSKVPPEDFLSFFTDNEMGRYAKRKGKGGLVARYLIKEILMDEFLDLDFKEIEILNTDGGKPEVHFLSAKPKKNIFVSLSHTKTEVAVIVMIDEL